MPQTSKLTKKEKVELGH